MGMNSQPPIPPCPAYPRLLLSPWILQLAYLLYPLVTQGHQRPPPTLRGNSTPPCTPQPQWPSLSANYLDSCCVHSPPPPPPPPPAILTPLSHFSLFTFPPPAPPTGVLYFLYSISHLLTLYPPLLPLLMLE